MAWRVPTDVCEVEHEVRKSRFIARIVPVQSREEVNVAVAAARADYPDARHHCWAYLLGRPADARSAGMSDDGEPAGTAGKPILNVLQHGHLGDVLIIVIRYFGGVKLGAGGLVRAYSSAAQQVLEAAPFREYQEMTLWQVRGDFACEQLLRHWLAEHGGQVDAVDYAEQVQLTLRLPAAASASLAALCAAHRIALEEVL